MKHLAFFLAFILLLSWLSGCTSGNVSDIAATTLPVYEFTVRLCSGTGLTVSRLITENVSCLHNYTLQVHQMQAIQGADAVVISGAGLEDFLDDALSGAARVIDASMNIPLTESSHHNHGHKHEHGHLHADDPHIWLSIENAKLMAANIYAELLHLYPENSSVFSQNLALLQQDLDGLQRYADAALADLTCRELITFHDGFSYLAESFHLTILEAVEEESGSEASAEQLKALIALVQEHQLPAVFVETHGSSSAAQIIASETGVSLFALDMSIAGESYFDAMYHNIDVLKEALQ